MEEHDVDWVYVFDNVPEVTMDDLPPQASYNYGEGFANPSPDSVSSWIGEVEHLLMKDDDDDADDEPNPQFCSDFLSNILLDSPAASSPDDKNSVASEDGGGHEVENVQVPDVNDGKNNENENNGEEEDPSSKKQRRQLRNRDAALRSRERKKIYVRDLEMKSRFLEGECRRLGRLLQCCVAENQALRFQLHNDKAFGASMAKQESAVLLLESLLLGSLLWFMGIICLFSLPRLPRPNQESVDNRRLESVAPKKAGSNIIGMRVLNSLFKSKRCKASRTKMKSIIHAVGVLV